MNCTQLLTLYSGVSTLAVILLSIFLIKCGGNELRLSAARLKKDLETREAIRLEELAKLKKKTIEGVNKNAAIEAVEYLQG